MSDDRSGAFGAIYLPALQRIRTHWLDLEPLVDSTSFDDPIAPTELRIELADGIGPADGARLDVQWSELDMYSFHYVDTSEVNWRFDRHPNTHSPDSHFHPLPAESDAEASCIEVTEVSLVTRAVHALWRTAYDADNLTRLNSLSNPP